MKYLLVALVLAAIVSLEIFHTLASDDGPEFTAACMAPEGKAAAIRDVLLAHLKTH